MRKLQTAVAYFVSIALIIGATFFGDHHLSVTQRSASDVDAGSDSGLLVRSGFSGLTPTANQTWVFNILDNRLYAYDGHNWQQQTLGRIQGAGIGAPTSSNDTNQGYSVGSLWWDTVGLNWYICQSNTASAAVWNVFTNRVAQTDINNSVAPKLSYADIMSDCVISGLLGSAPSSSLTMTTPAGVAYVGGLRTIAAAQSYTYPASQDTYDYLSSTGIISHTSVANGGSAPVGPTGLNIQKVVTNGTQITAVTQRSNTAPVTNVANATPSTQNAIPISQADARYATYGSINGPFSANYFMASPNGSSGSLTPRAIVSTDLPIVGIAQGGLGGATSATFGGVLYGNGLNTYLQTGSPPGPFYYLRSNSSNSALEWALTAGIGSITWSLPSYMTASPITMTTSGTQTFSFNNQNACLLFGGPANPTASATAPGFNSYDELASMGGASGTRPLPTMSTPSAPGTITHGGTAGTTSYSYAVAAVMSDTVTSSPASTATSTSTGNAALSSSNTNVIPMPSLPTGATYFNVYRTAGGSSQGYIGQTSSASFTDTGIAAVSPGWNLPSTAPTTYILFGEYRHSGNWTQPGSITSYYFRGKISGSVTLNNAWTVATEIPGGLGGTLNSGTYTPAGAGGGFGAGGSWGGWGSGSNTAAATGGGGGFGGVGGSGVAATTTVSAANGGRSYSIYNGLSGSSGGGSGGTGVAGGNGGAGGGGWYAEITGNLTCTSSCALTANGGAGATASPGGGGGGSGGGIQARILGTFTMASGATITAAGGNGGGATYGGGGGGGGFIEFSYNAISGSTAGITAPGGTAGTSATNGSSGQVWLNPFIQGPRSVGWNSDDEINVVKLADRLALRNAA